LGWKTVVTDRILGNLVGTGLFSSLLMPKLASLLFLLISMFGIKGKKAEELWKNKILLYLIIGLILYFISVGCFMLPVKANLIAVCYISLTTIGYLMILSGGTLLTRLIKDQLQKDIFNTENETFPQEERLLENEYSVNLPTVYQLKGKFRKSYINLISMTRGLLVAGSPGS